MTDSGRQIKSPADAVPNDYDKLFEKGWRCAVGREDIGAGYFTAAECAQIALSYGECIAAEMTTGGDHGEEWRAKFSKWEKQT